MTITEDFQKGFIAGLKAAKEIRNQPAKIFNEAIKFERERLKKIKEGALADSIDSFVIGKEK